MTELLLYLGLPLDQLTLLVRDGCLSRGKNEGLLVLLQFVLLDQVV